MKTLFNIFLCSFLCLNAITTYAAVATWIGGVGDWEDDNNWDTGDVPDYLDGVIINSGTVRVNNYAEANYIHLNGGDLEVLGTLYITPTLEWYPSPINKVRGLVIENGSSFDNYLNTIIQEFGGFIGSGMSIFCNGNMTNHANGFLFCHGDQSTGLHTYSQSATIFNYGHIFMTSIKTGMYLINPFENHGIIEIHSSDLAITSRESFYSSQSSAIYINGRIANETNAIWNQHGSLDVHYVSKGNASAVSIGGTFEIHNSGSLSVDGSHSSVQVRDIATFRVRGDLNIVNDRLYAHALSIQGFMVNHQKGNVFTSGYYGVSNSSGADTRNYGVWNMEDINYRTLKNSGVFSNRPKGKLYVAGRLELVSGSTFNNQGHMFVLGESNHISLSGQFNNTGTLNDVNNLMAAINNNTSIRVHKKLGPFTEGVPVSNVLDVGSGPGATVLSWYAAATGSTTVGTYNSSTNTFTPNSNAVGLTSVFVRTRINTGGVTRRHELIVENGINGSPTPFIQPKQNDNLYSNVEMTIAPNPTIDNFSISLRNTEEIRLKYTIYNTMGQRVSSGLFDTNSNLIPVPQQLNSGIYFVRVDSINDEHVDTKKVRIVR